MAVFIVTYDLNKNKDYETLWEELKRLDGHKAALSFYFVDVDTDDPRTLINHLKNYVDADDTLIASRVDVRPATWRAKAGTKEWLDGRFL
ncbi:hypothetical protein LCGC14_0827190 [marine sediment metagenome]|uniref:Uncharacterized protein n=1 Tax=marine sediment metagenome TaxID=412755 RepID=A0A0F9Q294_9ZZZZ